MKGYFVILLMLFNPFIKTQGQSEPVNCIIFIDGKLPERSTIIGSFAIYDSLDQKKVIPFSYQIGDLTINTAERKELFSSPINQTIEVEIKHIDNQGKKTTYTTNIQVGWLKWSFIIFRITSLKKGAYYFGISGPGFSSEFIKGEYNMFD